MIEEDLKNLDIGILGKIYFDLFIIILYFWLRSNASGLEWGSFREKFLRVL